MKNCIVISDSFKGSLSSIEICDIALEEIPKVFPDCRVTAIPVADGGEGTVDCFARAVAAQKVFLTVRGPLDGMCAAAYARTGDTAIIEMAAAAGLPMVGDRRDPSRATTYGVGQLIDHAVANGCRKIYLGLGGSATNDGGCGCAAALGVRFLNADGDSFVPVGGTLKDIRAIDIGDAAKKLEGVDITAMCDVNNPLYGKNGAAYIFAPQKGADEAMVKALDSGLEHLGRVIQSELGLDTAQTPGAGAAGGMGAGVMAFLGGRLLSGIEVVLELTAFDRLLDAAELVITGEGRLDSQSMSGKVISGVADHTAAKGVPLIAVVGCMSDSGEAAYGRGVLAVFATNRVGLPFEQLKPRAAKDYRGTLTDVLKLIKISQSIN